MNYLKDIDDTITAIATPPGEGAIAIVRLSGKKAINIIKNIFSKNIEIKKNHSIFHGKILGRNKELIDSVIVLIMKNPYSYTGEDCVEIQCHGGIYITKKILQRALEKGARLAYPGEFTFRAFKNKKIDLVQAEAVQELISAKTELAHIAAENHLEGALSHKVLAFQNELTNIAATIEAWIDFPEEDIEIFNHSKKYKIFIRRNN